MGGRTESHEAKVIGGELFDGSARVYFAHEPHPIRWSLPRGPISRIYRKGLCVLRFNCLSSTVDTL